MKIQTKTARERGVVICKRKDGKVKQLVEQPDRGVVKSVSFFARGMDEGGVGLKRENDERVQLHGFFSPGGKAT